MANSGIAALIILDGWGLNPRTDQNAVAQAHTPTMDRIWSQYPHTTLCTSGRAVGLPEGLMGNSEVGHLNLGAGRTVTQAMTRIDDEVRSGGFFKNRALLTSIDRVKKDDRRLHLMGLVSDGGVHSWPGHCEGLLKLAAARGVAPERVWIHALLDGRDTPPKSGVDRVRDLMEMCRSAGVGEVATLCGRYYAMDRDRRWDRTQVAYDCFTRGEGRPEKDPIDAVEKAYALGETDEFVRPVVMVNAEGRPKATVRDGDSILFFNFRGDRPRQITRAFVDDDFEGFERLSRPRVHFTCLTRYEKGVDVDGVAYPPEALSQDQAGICGEVLSRSGRRQLRIAETEKYAHVTFFFNGQEETPFEGEEHILVPSPKDVPTYDHKPEMSASDVADRLIEAVRGGSFDAAICNFANPDMVGHTGVLEAAVAAVSTVDACLCRVLRAVEEVGGSAIVTADHGNAEQMLHYDSGEPHTAHTINPVPFVLVDASQSGPLKSDGALRDVAPTLLGMMGLSPSEKMTGRDLRH